MKLPNLPSISKIPFLGLPDKPIVSTTQDFVPIADIVDNLVVYKDGGAALIMESTSLNFGLLSEKEQQAVIAAYAALLNSLSFPIQIIIRSQRKDISSYLKYLDEETSKIKNQKLLLLVQDHKNFIIESIKKKNVLGKTFYMIIPFSPLEMGVAKTLNTMTKRKGPLPFSKDAVLKKAKVTLFPKRDHLIRQGNRLSLRFRPLVTRELVELFYEIYNPKAPQNEKKEGQDGQ